ncbi:hypothetical protein PIB30_090607 [Stylosanthes scabra]|uniref:Uncharacterized protein n=1 Tax=Stylosanthes scabra TaxID=79078 RepID=A0ABU6QY08_9FABA|nr:hypothetical protein [Stylosanthes scabra]
MVGIPVVAFCDTGDNQDGNSGTEPDAGIGAQESMLGWLRQRNLPFLVEEAQLWEQSDNYILKNLTELEDQIQDELYRLRKEEGMRTLGPERMAHTVEVLTERHGLEKIPEILSEIQTKGKSMYIIWKLRPTSANWIGRGSRRSN